ncbi:hypothetical protein Y1Q_0009257 [Alligator mississippiensis]|uniref:Reverse transcriptase domain-containing protein n=1 Tax=Alligator mississippiensis TaxID=8496 RepID=A0A151M314_ALLMI|nr:hypothetical protein Y1Q_0009257 [Alligator mississippiensis]
MAKFSCLEKFIAMVQQFRHGTLAHVMDDDESSAPFPVTSYQTDGKHFNLRRLQVKRKLQEMTVHDLLFANDCSLNAKYEFDMQPSMDLFKTFSVCDNFGLTINTKKTEVMHQPAPGKPYVEPTITVNGQTLQAVCKLTYLSSTLSHVVYINDETKARIAKASVAFGRLHANVCEHRGISQQTKLKVYKAIVLPVLMYTCKTWTVYRSHALKLNHFYMGCLRKLMRIRCQDKVLDTEALTQACIPRIHTPLMKSQMRWAGHVTRIPGEQLPKKIFYGELKKVKLPQEDQKKDFKGSFKSSLKHFNIDPKSWEDLTHDHYSW